MRSDDLVLDDDDGGAGAQPTEVQEVAEQWLAINSPPGCPFSVASAKAQTGFWQVVIGSAARTLGTTDPATFEKALEGALETAFPGESFLVTGAQRDATKRSSLREDQ